VTDQADFGLDRPEHTADQDAVAQETPACVALVPLTATAHCSPIPVRSRSRADFLTQLIATAEHAPQTRTLRRATPADAKAAYGASRHHIQATGIRTRHTV